MALSDKEKQVLEELERQLTGAKPSAQPKKPVAPVGYARLLVTGSLLMVLGLGILIFSTTVHQIWLGVLAFLVMLTGLYFVSQNWSTKAIKAVKNDKTAPKTKQNYFEKRWDDRNNRS